ncbi:hypothetical protein CH296_18900 [Rhodococcus sp. 14-2496-1d]|uniref:MerR family transcriptional regulator n=1 Tax=Rhodococcus sp. 14-2496-1d TaxID=2023146 RepID=UPI000B9AF42D|nr:helix-turn-helix domain-containing protein [Rhodococcus sp. 14-2496-1d]OZF28479.1 hypothetical protein CH296_18900 [Rhodococcus sp. 14-2496-1d]
MPQNDLVTTSEVAQALHVDSSAVRRWVAQNKLHPAVTTPGGHYRFNRSDIEQLRTQPSATPEVIA